MSLASLIVLLQTVLSLLTLVNSNPSLPQSLRDNAQQVAQQAITQATSALSTRTTTLPGGGGVTSTQTPVPPALTSTQTSASTLASCTFNGQAIASGQSVTAYQTTSVSYGSQCVSQQRTCANGALAGSYAYASCAAGAVSTCSWNGQPVANGASVTAYQASSVAYGQQCVSEQRTCGNGILSGSYAYASCAVGQAASCSFNGQTATSGQSVTAYQSASVASGSTCVSQTRACNNGVLSGTYGYASCAVQSTASATSCSFNGQTIASGQTVTAYQTSSVASGSQCASESRTCTNVVLSGSYAYASCAVQTSVYAPNTPIPSPLPTNATDFVTNLFQCVFLRPVDQSFATNSQSYWTNYVTSAPANIENAFRQYFEVPEYVNKSVSDQTFVTQLYDCILYRAPDAAGLTLWVGKLQGGQTRDQLITSFLASNEYLTTVQPKYQARPSPHISRAW